MAPNLDETRLMATNPGTISLATSVAGIPFAKPLGNSPNPLATTKEMLNDIASSPATGCFTTRTACPGFVHDDARHQWRALESGNTINCLGYSCYDFAYYCDAIPQVQASNPDTVAIFSLTGTKEEVADLLEQTVSKLGAAAVTKLLVEINLSCPNIPGKPPVAYDPVAIRAYLQGALARGTHGLKVGVKLAPMLYDTQFNDICGALNDIPELSFVTTINTIGCGLAVDIDTEAPALAEAMGASYGGLGGPAVHNLALGNVRRLRQLLRADIDIIGVGGVNSGAAVFSFLLCGASAVMMASTLLTEGVDCFARIEQELLDILSSKGYTSLNQVIGKLKDGDTGMACPAKPKVDG